MSDIKFSTEGKEKSNVKRNTVLVIVGVIVVAILIVLFNCFSIINEGFIGVKYNFGKIVQDDLSAGLNLHIPFIEEIEQVDTREQIYSVTTDAYTSDTQTVNELKVKLNYYYDPLELSNIIRNIGVSNVETKLLVQNVEKITKDQIGKVKAEELVQSRSKVQEDIQLALTNELAKSGIIVRSFAIENLSFDDAFEASIQEKVIAAQAALKEENNTIAKQEVANQVVIAAQAEADSVKIAAEAQAQAIKLIQEQLASSPNYVEYLKIQNWNGVLPTVISDGVDPFVVLNPDGSTTTGTTPQTAE